MKVFTKILGAVLLLGCLAYISFVFGKYVLSSTLLKSIPKSERIINTDNSTLASTPDSSRPQGDFSPQVRMRVMPHPRSTRDDSTENDGNTDSSTDGSDDADTPHKKLKKFDEGELSSSRRRRSHRRSENTKKTDETEKVALEKEATPAPPKKKPLSTSAPIRRMNQTEKTEESSPVPKAEKSTSSVSNGDDAASISPVPKPE